MVEVKFYNFCEEWEVHHLFGEVRTQTLKSTESSKNPEISLGPVDHQEIL